MNYPLLKNQLPASIKKVWKKTSFLTFSVLLLLGIGIISTLTYFKLANGTWYVIFSSYFALILLLFIFNFLLINYRYHYFRYELTIKEVVFQKGYIFRSITYVPFSRIQHIETEQGPFLRRENLMELVIYTAATAHRIAGLSLEESEKLRESLLERVEEASSDD
ncbi:PH domain-containing protein [Carnobacterium sp. TMP28]|uniref:PH domain-containing protein n=1 Tax=Carnobacterium sp. TMP28 TaxID=3397060 RepID=UPI0039E15588